MHKCSYLLIVLTKILRISKDDRPKFYDINFSLVTLRDLEINCYDRQTTKFLPFDVRNTKKEQNIKIVFLSTVVWARVPQQDAHLGAERARVDREPRPPALPGGGARHQADIPGTVHYIFLYT